MKTKQTFFICLMTVSLATGLAQGHSLSWFTIDGGGGASAGGRFSLSGTIGQPDAGWLTNEGDSLQGGFWSGAANDSPRLRLFRYGGSVVLAWPKSAAGFRLQTATNPRTSHWAQINQPALTVEDEHWVILPETANHQFFRLHKP